jgi:catechol 2,3-dioxygenase-like lactoylglutathione lyase family enzyme
MRIALTSVMVDDQEKALAFYTDVLGFVKKFDIPMGEFRWLTVVSTDAPEGVELVLEPTAHPAAKVFQKALFDDGIPATSFESSDIHAEHERLRGRGVVFRGEPTHAGPVWVAKFEDTCGNLIQLHQPA